MDKMQKTLNGVNEQMRKVNVNRVDTRMKYMIDEQDSFKKEIKEAFERSTKVLERIGERIGSTV